MHNELDDIFNLVDSCLKCNRQDLHSGKRPFVVRSDQFQQLNCIFKGQEERTSLRGVLTEYQQIQLDTFHALLEKLIANVVITQRNVDSVENLVLDVNLLKTLKYLQLCRIRLKTLRGLSHLKTHLKTMLIDRCKDLNVVCMAGKLQWAELVELRIRRCGFPRDNGDLFQGMTWLRRLDLNFCEFETCDFLRHLPLLTHLDLSFNRLTKVPRLGEDAGKNLKTLILHHNYIADLNGIEILTQLNKLDLSWNWLSDKMALSPLLQLRCLKCLDAANNPISFVQFYRVFVALALGTSAEDFKLDGKLLNYEERAVIGDYPRRVMPNEISLKSSLLPSAVTSGVKRTVSVSKIKPNSSKVRQVVIQESSGPSVPEESVLTDGNRDSEVPEDIVEDPPKTPSLPPDAENLVHSLLLEDPLCENEALCSSTPKLSLVCIEAQVHAIENQKESNSASDEKESAHSDQATEETFEDPIDATIYKSCEASRVNSGESDNAAVCETIDSESSAYGSNDDSIDSDDSEPGDDDVLWLVQRYNEDKTSHKSIFLSLLDSKLVERSTKSNKTLYKWPLSVIETCSKTSVDPVTIEIRFNTSRKDKNFRCYVMEFSDAQILLKKVYETIEEHKVLRCKVCSSTLTMEIHGMICLACQENGDPKKFSDRFATEMRDSSTKASSILSSGASPECDSGSTAASSTPTESCSAASSERSSKNDTLTTGGHPKHYESDVEVISSLSQSSVEVLDEESATPERKISQEERKSLLAPPLSTVLEAVSPLSALTESSSSGSLTESVVTTYEPTNNATNKKNSNDCLLEECESSSVINSRGTDSSEENGNVLNGKTEVYSYSNFIDVDHRIKLLLHQSVFQGENENLSAFIKCHVWKTGGIDYDGCLVLSNRMLYFFQLAPTDFSVSSDASEWLTLADSYNLDCLNCINHLPWNLGFELKVKNISFLLLIMDKSRTENVESHLKSLKLKCKITSSPSSKINALQQIVLESSSRNAQSIRDPDIKFFTLCLSLSILKDDYSEETMRLAGVIVASSEFFILPGNLSWLCSNSAPMVSAAKDFSSLIEVEKRKNVLIFHFLDEAEAVEEIWSIKLPTNEQVERMIESIKAPWESMFSAPLEIKGDCV